MSARPGRITDLIEVDLPRERNVETREMERYFELVTRVREALRSGEGVPADPAAAARVRAEGLSA
jgi:NitT/TauT family transport system ATP-binding protein